MNANQIKIQNTSDLEAERPKGDQTDLFGKAPAMNRKVFLVSFEFEDLTEWRISDEDLLDFMKGVLRTVVAGQTEGTIPKVEVKRIPVALR
jgi:hypothetical protein